MAHDRTHFGGLAGQVLHGLAGGSTLLTGMTLASGLFLTARGLAILERVAWLPAVGVLWISLAVAFHAVEAAHDSGFPAAPGLRRWLRVGAATALGSAVWLVPWMLWSLSTPVASPLLETVGMPSALAAGLYVFACLIATPALLVVATHSRNLSDVFSPAHWSAQWRGHSTDLLTVYTVESGALALIAGVTLPPAVALLGIHAGGGIAAAATAACLVLGAWATVVGRLSGTFQASAPGGAEAPAVEAPTFEAGLVYSGPALDTGLNRDLPEEPSPEPADAPAPQPEPAEPAPVRAAGEPATPTPQDESPPEAARIRRYAAPKKPVSFDLPPIEKNDRRTPLLDGEKRVEQAMKRFRLDPSHTLSKLAELNQRFAANPHVLQALAICLHRTGHIEQAFQAARRAFPLLFEHGHVSLAAAMFYELRSDLQRLDLKREQVFAIAGVLHKADELAAAAKAYSLVIHSDPRDVRAIKGLLDVADKILYDKKKPPAALKVYMFLLEHCADPATAELVRQGITSCRAAEEETLPVD